MPKKKKEEETTVNKDISEEVKNETNPEVLLQMAEILLKIDRAIMDVQTGIMSGLLDRLGKYEDVEKDRELISRLGSSFGKDEDNASKATESDG